MKETLKQFCQNYIAVEKNKKNIDKQYIDFLKVIWTEFDEIRVKTKNKRKIFILEQIEKLLIDPEFQNKIKNSELPDKVELRFSQDLKVPQIKLKEIDLINFRGFKTNDNKNGRRITFNEKVTLFFSPNGGGKTSLCEALEWSLTGDSSERINRKAEPVGDYFQNNYKNEPKYNKTKLILSDDEVNIPNPIFDRCFLEKNRIEKFAKLAIQQRSDLQEVLGELFGFSEIIEFVKEFGQDLTPTENERSSENRENWQIWMNWNNKKIEQEKDIETIKKDENDAIEELKKLIGDKSFNKRKDEIDKLINKLKEEIEVIENDYSTEFSANDFCEKIDSFLKKIDKWSEYKKEISSYSTEIDYESLFQAANKIFKENLDTNKCPLCDTPFKQSGSIFKRNGVVVDPREKVERELIKLKKLTDLKNEEKEIESELKGVDFRWIRDLWKNIQDNLIEDNWNKIAGKIEKPHIPMINFIELESKLEQEMELFIETIKKVFKKDFSNLYKIEELIIKYRKRRKENQDKKPEKEDKIKKLREELENLQKKNDNLIAKKRIRELKEEKLQEILNQSDNAKTYKKFLNNYSEFLKSLQEFQSKFILKEGTDIDNFITGYYCILNQYDNDSEEIKKIHLPKNIQERFCIIYKSADENIYDALNILSEGHLKTLGLATLLARATKYKAPTLVFDDAINAIDSDHRDNIASLLTGKISDKKGLLAFSDDWEKVKKYLKECQFVITTHDRFFDEKIANLFDRDQQSRYVLYFNKDGICYCEKGNEANFEAKIDYYLKPDILDIRSAIFHCRIWLEELVFEIAANFKKPSNKKPIDFNNIKIDKRTRNLKNPALNIVIKKLIRNLDMEGATDDDKKISSILKDIYEERDGKYLWFFEILNQESHYRRLDHINISHAPTSKEVEKMFKKINEIYELCSSN